MTAETFQPQAYWAKLKGFARLAGEELVETSLKLYYSLQDDDTPAWARTVIVGALVYFISPADAVPDFLPGGYSDDLATVAGALWVVTRHIKNEHRDRARGQLQRWFPRSADH